MLTQGYDYRGAQSWLPNPPNEPTSLSAAGAVGTLECFLANHFSHRTNMS